MLSFLLAVVVVSVCVVTFFWLVNHFMGER